MITIHAFFKKILKPILVILTILLVLDIIIVVTFEYTDRDTQNKIVNGSIYSNNTIFIKDTINNDTINDINCTISNLPSVVQNCINKNKWYFVIANEVPSGINTNTLIHKNANTSLAGITTRINRTIFINASQSGSDIHNTIIHESAHVVDCEYGYVSNSRKFYSLYKQYADTLSNDQYYQAHQSEFFAFAFSEYCLHPDELKNKAPEIYEFFFILFKKDVTQDNIFDKLITRPRYFIRLLFKNII